MNITIKKNDLKVADLLFYTSYVLYLVFTILSTSFYAIYVIDYLKYVMYFCIVLLLFKELFCKKIKIKEIIYIIICIFLSMITFMFNNGITMYPLFLFIYSSRNMDFKRIAKVTIIIQLILFLFIFFSARMGIIIDYTSNASNRVRNYMGFRYSLFPSSYIFNITALLLYITNTKKKMFYLFLLLINSYVFFLTDSKLCFYLALALIVIFYIKNNKENLEKKKKKNFKYRIMPFSFIVCSILSLYLIVNYNSNDKTYNEIDNFLENRLLFGNKSLSTYPIKLFGNNVTFIGNGLEVDGTKSNEMYNYVDCLYLSLLEKYGIAFFSLFISIYTYTAIKAYRDKNYNFLLIFLCLSIKGIFDDLELLLYYNTFWLIIGEYIRFNNQQNINEVEKKSTNMEVLINEEKSINFELA